MGKNKAVELDALQELVSYYVAALADDYDMPPRVIASLIDVMKQFAAEYHNLVIAGKVPTKRQYNRQPAQAIDNMNKVISEFDESSEL